MKKKKKIFFINIALVVLIFIGNHTMATGTYEKYINKILNTDPTRFNFSQVALFLPKPYERWNGNKNLIPPIYMDYYSYSITDAAFPSKLYFYKTPKGTINTRLMMDFKDASYGCQNILNQVKNKYGKPVLSYFDSDIILNSAIATFEKPTYRAQYFCMESINNKNKTHSGLATLTTGNKSEIKALKKRPFIKCEGTSTIIDEQKKNTYFFYIDDYNKTLRREDSSAFFGKTVEFNDKKITINDIIVSDTSTTSININRITGLMTMKTMVTFDNRTTEVPFNGTCSPYSESSKF